MSAAVNTAMTTKIRGTIPRSAPLANPDEVLRLVTRAKEGDLHARDEIVRANMGFLYQRARRIARATGHDPDDLVQEGVLAIFIAIEKFDATCGVKFLSYAAFWIIQVMMRTAERSDAAALSGAAHLVMKYRRALRDNDRLVAGGMSPEDALTVIAGGSKHVSTKALAENFEALRALRVTSIDAQRPGNRGDSKTYTLLDVIEDGAPHIDDELETHERVQRVRHAIRNLWPKLNKTERLIIELRFLQDGDDKKTLQEIGDMIGRTRERVRQIDQKLRLKLRDAILRLDVAHENERRTKARARLLGQLTDKGAQEGGVDE